jgi:hypothetical protein
MGGWNLFSSEGVVEICGIVGISFGEGGPYSEVLAPSGILQSLLPAAVHRGPHAYGWMYGTSDGEIYTVKHQGRSDTDDAIDTMVIPVEHEDKLLWLVGHVRYYTHGSPENMNNNHPLTHGRIVGVHNGVLRNHESILAVTGRQNDDAEVDSEAIFAAVNKWGHRNGLSRIHGDMVAVYANLEKPRTLHIARTVGRPLHFAKTLGGGLMFASETRIGDAAIGVAASDYSPLSSHRLVRVRGGRIVYRTNLNPPPTAWKRFEGGPLHNPFDDNTAHTYEVLPPKQIGSKISAALDAANRASEGRAEGESVRGSTADSGGVSRPRRKPARGYARSLHLDDGDRVGDKYYYRGLLLTQDEYEAEVGSVPTEEEEEF